MNVKPENNDDKIVLVLPGLPISANASWRSGTGRRGGQLRTFRSAKYYAYLDNIDAFFCARRVSIPKTWPFVGVELIFSPRDRRDLDVDNRIKPFLDALTHAGFWPDDKIVADVRASLTKPVCGGRTVAIFTRRAVKYQPLAEDDDPGRPYEGKSKTKVVRFDRLKESELC